MAICDWSTRTRAISLACASLRYCTIFCSGLIESLPGVRGRTPALPTATRDKQVFVLSVRQATSERTFETTRIDGACGPRGPWGGVGPANGAPLRAATATTRGERATVAGVP